MFFLLRCTFWLGLVFANLSWHFDGPVLPSGQELATQAAQQCLASPQACSNVMAGAEKLRSALTDPQPVSTPAKPGAHKVSADTLLSSDRAPAWRGPI